MRFDQKITLKNGKEAWLRNGDAADGAAVFACFNTAHAETDYLLSYPDDHFADSVVEKVGFYLGQATANIANILNPDSVVIGGGVSAAGEFLRSRVEKYFVTYAFPQVRKTTKVKIAELGNDAGIIGAASLASQFVD